MPRLEAALEVEGGKLREAAGRGSRVAFSSASTKPRRWRGRKATAATPWPTTFASPWRRRASNWQLAFTIRTDSFPELQSHRRFQNLEARGYDLRAIPVFPLRKRGRGAGETLRRRRSIKHSSMR